MKGAAMKPNSVTLIASRDEWIVVVVEDGEALQRSFKIQSHAQSWCDGQCIRLGLPVVLASDSFELAEE